MFRYLLVHADGEPHDPPVVVSAVPNWDVGEMITFGVGDQSRVVGIQWDGLDPALEPQGVSGIFTIEPVD